MSIQKFNYFDQSKLMELIDSNFPTGTPDLSDFAVLLTVQEPCPIASPCEIARNIEASQLMTAQASVVFSCPVIISDTMSVCKRDILTLSDNEVEL